MFDASSSKEKVFHLLIWAAEIYLAWCVYCCFYNLYLHPLRGFPGPKLAAASRLYEFWYDVVKDGQYLWKIERLHEEYGPIIRVNPSELHVRDSQFYSQIYASGSRVINKVTTGGGGFAAPRSVASTVDHHLHRARRGYLGPFLSKRAIVKMEDFINERIDCLCRRFESCIKDQVPIALDPAFAAFTVDIITWFLYGEHSDYVGNPDRKVEATEAADGLTGLYNLSKFFSLLMPTLNLLPNWAVRLISPPAAGLLALKRDTKQRILSSMMEGESKIEPTSFVLSALTDPEIPPAERHIDRLMDEGTVVILAGSETTARALSVGMFYLLDNESHFTRLRDELTALPTELDQHYSLAQLEKLPYLSGVVRETLRLSFGPIDLFPRVAVTESLQYGDFTIPPGTPVSQSTYFVHTDPAIFPDPFTFDPDRWARGGPSLNKFLVNFSKGSRQCVGIE
ncbi:hypothetical protein CP533_1074 [Ophiocordyceps camponoti-saundersi (nom. inval.)]|nr:hypothetical protein CP533_1074 [Ophiocordyceps camponoti-saundersi (nom. inval.)]